MTDEVCDLCHRPAVAEDPQHGELKLCLGCWVQRYEDAGDEAA